MNMSNSQALELAMAYVNGRHAGAQRQRFTTNPYPVGSEERKEWMRGWRESVALTIKGYAA